MPMGVQQKEEYQGGSTLLTHGSIDANPMPSKMDWKNGARLSEVIPAPAKRGMGGYPPLAIVAG